MNHKNQVHTNADPNQLTALEQELFLESLGEKKGKSKKALSSSLTSGVEKESKKKETLGYLNFNSRPKNIMNYWEHSTHSNIENWQKVLEAAQQEDARKMWEHLERLNVQSALSLRGPKGAWKKNTLITRVHKLVGNNVQVWERIASYQMQYEQESFLWSSSKKEQGSEEQKAKQNAEASKTAKNLQEYLFSKGIVRLHVLSVLWGVCPKLVVQAHRYRRIEYEEKSLQAKNGTAKAPYRTAHKWIGLGEDHKKTDPLVKGLLQQWARLELLKESENCSADTNKVQELGQEQEQMAEENDKQSTWGGHWEDHVAPIVNLEDQNVLRQWLKGLHTDVMEHLMDHFEHQAHRRSEGKMVYDRGNQPVRYDWMLDVLYKHKEYEKNQDVVVLRQLIDGYAQIHQQDMVDQVHEYMKKKQHEKVRQWCSWGTKVALEHLDAPLVTRLMDVWHSFREGYTQQEQQQYGISALPWNKWDQIGYKDLLEMLKASEGEPLEQWAQWIKDEASEWSVQWWAVKQQVWGKEDKVWRFVGQLPSPVMHALSAAWDQIKQEERQGSKVQGVAEKKWYTNIHLDAKKLCAPKMVQVLEEHEVVPFGIMELLSVMGEEHLTQLTRTALMQGAQVHPMLNKMVDHLLYDAQAQDHWVSEMQIRNWHQVPRKRKQSVNSEQMHWGQSALHQAQSILLLQSVLEKKKQMQMKAQEHNGEQNEHRAIVAESQRGKESGGEDVLKQSAHTRSVRRI